jgi:hypothetical protein
MGKEKTRRLLCGLFCNPLTQEVKNITGLQLEPLKVIHTRKKY